MYLAYTYFIKNKITGQFYYGFRSKNISLKRAPVDDFWVRYFTSSEKVKELINLYGRESFDVQILMEDADWHKCYEYEQRLIQNNLSEELCLNKHCDLGGKWSFSGSSHSEKSRAKMSRRQRDRWTDEDRENARQRALSRGLGNKPGYNNPMKGKKARPEVVAYRNANPGGSNTHWLGKKFSDEHRENMSKNCISKRAVMCEGIKYDSIRAATRAYGYKYDGIIQYRVNKSSYTEYYYVDDKSSESSN